MTKVPAQLLVHGGFPLPENYNDWAAANSIDRFILQDSPVLIIGNTWIRAYTLPVRSWPTDTPDHDQMRPGAWGDYRYLHHRSRWRWYLLRVQPEAYGYRTPPALAQASTVYL